MERDTSTGDTFDMSGDFRQAHIYIKSAVQGGPAIRIPLQRPPRADHFTDRERELAQLLADLQPGRVVTLCGPGGIGKTALAAEAAWNLAPGNEPPERFPDGVLFHSFYGRPEADLAYEKIVYAFGDEPRPTPEAAALRVLGGKQALLILIFRRGNFRMPLDGNQPGMPQHFDRLNGAIRSARHDLKAGRGLAYGLMMP